MPVRKNIGLILPYSHLIRQNPERGLPYVDIPFYQEGACLLVIFHGVAGGYLHGLSMDRHRPEQKAWKKGGR